LLVLQNLIRYLFFYIQTNLLRFYYPFKKINKTLKTHQQKLRDVQEHTQKALKNLKIKPKKTYNSLI